MKSKSKAIPITGREGLQAYAMLRIPHFLDNRLRDGGEVISLTRRQHFTPQKDYMVLTLRDRKIRYIEENSLASKLAWDNLMLTTASKIGNLSFTGSQTAYKVLRNGP
jgi:hypothetical protein